MSLISYMDLDFSGVAVRVTEVYSGDLGLNPQVYKKMINKLLNPFADWAPKMRYFLLTKH